MKVLKKIRVAEYCRSQKEKTLKNKVGFKRAKYKEGKKKNKRKKMRKPSLVTTE